MGSACCSKSAVSTKSMRSMRSVVPAPQVTPQPKSIFHYTEDTEATFVEMSFGKSRKVVKWKRGELLGEGAYAKVYQCMNIETGELLAIKHFTVLFPQFSEDPRRVEREYLNLKKEIMLLRDLDHPNIVKYVQTDLATDRDSIDVVLEYVPGGSLKQVLSNYGGLEETVIATYLRQLLSGLSYLHSHGVIHRDLKSANILLTASGGVKLTDFGSSKRLDAMNLQLTKSLKGSPYWMAPEVITKQGHCTAADIWSLGCVVIEMASGRPPWSNYSHSSKEVMKLIGTAGSMLHIDLPDFPSGSPALLSLLKCCVQREPSQRPTAQQLLSHPFVLGNYNDASFQYEPVPLSSIQSLESTAKTTAQREDTTNIDTEQV